MGASNELVAAIAAGGAALGALVGATAGGLVDFVLERKREKRQALVGARLTRLDLSLAASTLKSSEDDGKWWVWYETPMPAWDTYRDALSARLSADDLVVVTQSVAELDRFGKGMKEAPIAPGAAYRDVASSLEHLNKMRRNATAAHEVLATLANAKAEPGLLHDDQQADPALKEG